MLALTIDKRWRVAEVTRTWQTVAAEVGARRAEITRMASAFEHEDLQAALKRKPPNENRENREPKKTKNRAKTATAKTATAKTATHTKEKNRENRKPPKTATHTI